MDNQKLLNDIDKIVGVLKCRTNESKNWRKNQDRLYFRDKQYTWQAWQNCNNRSTNPLQYCPTYDELIVEQKKLDGERIDKAIAHASELAQIEVKGLRMLHKSQMQLLEAQQQSRQVDELYRKFFNLK